MRLIRQAAVVADAQRFLFDALQAAGQYVRGLRPGQLRYTLFNNPAQSRLTPKQLAVGGPWRTIQATLIAANGTDFCDNTSGHRSVEL